ncbi:L-type lectin-domain containing receptor kinase IV.2-like [Chenopodium quinoa]|uniref:non-specific serine/threonine protein kinase n=1 Tax=Chenopodium quinoa TaxID=63459 RepID=A0A803LX30_CHEQI|nr:L-type lectin-domain containing receptor kinase IV.2-like [Chenopodium quinoa]
MAFKILFHIIVICFGILLTPTIFAQDSKQFIYQGFQQANLHIDGAATVQSNGLLQLTNYTKQLTAHAFHPQPLNFSSSSSLSFSTHYVFAMYPEIQAISGHGIVFVLSPSMSFPHGVPGKFFGLFNSSSDFMPSDHIFAVELDTIQDYEFSDIDSNHAGININSLISNASASAAYYSDAEKVIKSLNLISAKRMQVWIDYNHKNMLVQVTMAPIEVPKPSRPLLSLHVNLSEVLTDTMYVGFSSSTGSVASRHYLLGWSFAHGREEAQRLDLSKLPTLPRYGSRGRKLSIGSMILLIVISVIVVTIGIVFYVIRRKKFEEVMEDWEQEYLLQRFSFKDLYKATKGFKDKELLGAGGFGKVYKGILSSPKLEVAVKRVSHGSGQGMREFVAEVACMGRLRHRNLVQLLGYCRRKGELLLVYDYMPNGSLDKYLYEDENPSLSWSARFKIIRGVASALVYLHEEWEQVIVHRDVKASNILLDADMNARLGDFGLARLYDHGTNPQTTHVVGTVGYLAPELTRKGKATTSTDVFSFGVFILEVACGRSPISLQGPNEETYLIDWVYECWKKGAIVEASDPKLGRNYVVEELELVLKLGMVCCYPKPEGRPNMRQVMQFLNGDNALPEMVPFDTKAAHTTFNNQTLGSYPTSSEGNFANVSYSSESILHVGR